MECDIGLVLREFYEGTAWSLSGNNYGSLKWNINNTIPKPTYEEIQSRWTDELILKTKLDKVREKRNKLLTNTDKYALPDWPHETLSIQENYINHRQTLRNLPILVTPLEDGSVNIWVTNQNGTLQIGDSITSSNISGYFTKGEPTIVTAKKVCDFSASTTETYYSNVVNFTQKDEEIYYTSNVISYYEGNVVSHYSNLIVYDDVNVYTNIDIEEYSNLEADTQSNYTTVLRSDTSPIELDGYTPIFSYSNVTLNQYDANIHGDHVKVIIPSSNVIEYSNITATKYEALDSNHIITPTYTSFYHEISNTSIRVQQYAELTPDQRTEYTVQSVPAVTSNLQSFYTPQTKTNVHELRYLDGSGVLTDQANAVWTARQVECTFPGP